MKARMAVLPPIKIGKKVVEQVDELVEKGYFRSRSDAVRNAIIIFLREFEESRRIRQEAARIVRETRDKMWEECLKKAKGDKDKAHNLFIEKFLK